MAISFRKVRISDETFEAAGVWDVDGDGVLDIISGAFWYKGPDFKIKREIAMPSRHAEYYDDFSTIPCDLDGTGRKGIITGGWWGANLRFRACPADPMKQPWTERILVNTGAPIETTRAWDIDGDGVDEIFPNCPPSREVAIYKPVFGDGKEKLGTLQKHVIFTFPEGQTQGHGFGVGDIAGNGRKDILLAKGWLECPADPWKGEWKWHPEFNFGSLCNPAIIVDINGDGLCEIIAGSAHRYGLDWWQQTKNADGSRTWTRHPIDPENSQYHDLHWVDIDGDGQCELVTGKRHRAHNGGDPGEWDDYGIYYFKWTGEGFSKQIIDWGRIFDNAKGTGIEFAIVDLRGTGRLDIVAPGKDGLTIFYNEGIAKLGQISTVK